MGHRPPGTECTTGTMTVTGGFVGQPAHARHCPEQVTCVLLSSPHADKGGGGDGGDASSDEGADSVGDDDTCTELTTCHLL